VPTHQSQDESDAELIRRSSLGDRPAFEVLVSRHERAVFRLARAITQTNEDAEDVLQETFLSAFRGADGYRGAASVRTWLLSITRHGAIRHEMRESRIPVTDLSAEDLRLDAGWGSDPEAIVIAAQQQRRLRDAVESLPSHYREILILRDLEQISGEQVALLLGTSLAAVKSRLHRARLHLLAKLREHHARA
jgi:RNA polymerase sigma-70 factor (ECF subfamily)